MQKHNHTYIWTVAIVAIVAIVAMTVLTPSKTATQTTTAFNPAQPLSTNIAGKASGDGWFEEFGCECMSEDDTLEFGGDYEDMGVHSMGVCSGMTNDGWWELSYTYSGYGCSGSIIALEFLSQGDDVPYRRWVDEDARDRFYGFNQDWRIA